MVVKKLQEVALGKQLAELKFELDMERKLTAELKRLMIATISDDLQGQVEALTEDKISLASRVEKYSEKVIPQFQLGVLHIFVIK
uniref:AAA_9 domain-containing protein n=1 Tax=Angiostrongylus cantonensis TaxID=6313 RepID=A0A0K0D6R3_ANGCA